MREVRDRLRALDLIEAPDLRERIRGWEPGAPQTVPLLKRAAIAMLALVVAGAGIAFAVRALHSSKPPTRPASTIENGLIVFSRGGPDSGLFVMNGDGTDVRRLPSEGGDTDPTWSPDGSRIAFVRFHDGNAGIFVMDADGTSVHQLTDGRSDGSPAWSPDGTRIAFAREARDPGAEVANADIYVVNADGTGLARVTDDPLMEASPSWSPDGSRIAFVGYDEASGGEGPSAVRLYVMNQDGTDIRALGPENVAQPAWSPDGSEIAYVDTETGSIMAIRPDGTGQRQIIGVAELVGGVHLVYGPTWSPDGTKMAFMAGPDAGNTHIYVVRREGSGVAQLTREPASDAEPAWQPVVADESPDASPLPTPTETPTPSPVSTAEIGQTIDVGQASALMYADGSLWVDVLRDAATTTGTVLRIDPGSGEIQARIPVEAYPDSEHGGSGMVFDGRYLWIVGTRWSADGVAGGILVRIDPDTDTAETIDLPVGATGSDLVFDDGFLWTTGVSSPGKDPRVLQIDPVAGAVVSETPIDAEWWGGLAVEGGAIWVVEMSVRNSTVQGDATLVRLELGTGAVLAQVPAVDENGVMGSTTPVAAEGTIWVPTGGELRELDPQTGEALSRFDLAVGGDLEPTPDRSVWCLCGFGWNELERLNPGSGELDVTVHLDRKPIPIAMAVAPDSVWVLTYEGTLTRVALS